VILLAAVALAVGAAIYGAAAILLGRLRPRPAPDPPGGM
jgi:hypothetical protein